MPRCGADVAARYGGRTALHCAAKAGFAGIVDALIEHGGDVNALDDGGQTPLDAGRDRGPEHRPGARAPPPDRSRRSAEPGVMSHRLYLPIALLTAFTAHAFGASYTVAPGGDDRGAGSETAPWRTIQQAVNRAGPGDTVWVRTGIYRERIVMERGGTKERPLVLSAAPGARVVVTGADPLEEWQRAPGTRRRSISIPGRTGSRSGIV